MQAGNMLVTCAKYFQQTLKLNKNGAATKQDLSKQNSPHTYLTIG